MRSRISFTKIEKTRANVLLVMAIDEGVLNEDTHSLWGTGPLIDEFEVGNEFSMSPVELPLVT